MGFLMSKVWQILKQFTGTFRQAQTFKLYVFLPRGKKLPKSNTMYHAPIPQFQKSSCFEPLSHWAYMVTCSSTMRLHITLFESRKLQEYIAHNISILEFYISK